jgi:adsorption protein B
MTASTYIDEFAELHTKDLLVRGALCGMVPCAGVGAGFSREIIDKIAEAYGGQVFNTATFTEDYDLAFRLKALGGTSYLLHHFIEREKIIKAGWLRPERRKVVRELVCTREFFPTRFRDAVKQKSRWTLGIVFHGWQQRGWEGGLALRYMIWRDRKSLLTNSINMLGYVLLALGVLDLDFGVVNAVGEFYRHMPSHHWLREVIDFNWLILLNRCAQRMVCTARIFSWREAALTVPKLVWANVINFCAVAKASYLFVLTTYMGRKLVWAKTDHVYPSDEELLGLHAQPVPEERHD